MEWLNQLIYGSMMYSLQKFVLDSVNEYMGALVELREQAISLLEHPYFVQAILYFQGIVGLTLALKIAWESWTTYHLRASGDPEADPSGLLERTGHAGAIIASVPWIVQQVWLFGISIQRDLSQLPGTDMMSEQDALLSFFVNCLTRNQILAMGIIAAVVIYLLVVLQSLVFSVEISMSALTGLWMALGLTNPNSNSFSLWWKDVLSTSLIPVAQLFLLKGAFVTWGSIHFSSDGSKLLMFIVFMYIAYKIPSALKNHAANTSTGVGRNTVNVAKTVVMKLLTRR